MRADLQPDRFVLDADVIRCVVRNRRVSRDVGDLMATGMPGEQLAVRSSLDLVASSWTAR
jgi:hypothetical protein